MGTFPNFKVERITDPNVKSFQSIKIRVHLALMNLFAGQQWTKRTDCGHSRGKRGRDEFKE